MRKIEEDLWLSVLAAWAFVAFFIAIISITLQGRGILSYALVLLHLIHYTQLWKIIDGIWTGIVLTACTQCLITFSLAWRTRREKMLNSAAIGIIVLFMLKFICVAGGVFSWLSLLGILPIVALLLELFRDKEKIDPPWKPPKRQSTTPKRKYNKHKKEEVSD